MARGDQRVSKSVSGAGLGQQSCAEHALLPGEGAVQRVVGIVVLTGSTTEPPLLTSLSHSRCVFLLAASCPTHHSVERDKCHRRLVKHLYQFFADVDRPWPS